MKEHKWNVEIINSWIKLRNGEVDALKAVEEMTEIRKKLSSENAETLVDKTWKLCMEKLLKEEKKHKVPFFAPIIKTEKGIPICQAIVQEKIWENEIKKQEKEEQIKSISERCMICIPDEYIESLENSKRESCLPLSKEYVTVKDMLDRIERPFKSRLDLYYEDVKLHLAVNARKKDNVILDDKMIPLEKKNAFLMSKFKIEETLLKKIDNKKEGELLLGMEGINGNIKIKSFNARLQFIFILNMNVISKRINNKELEKFKNWEKENIEKIWKYFEQGSLCPQNKYLYYSEFQKMIKDADFIKRELQAEEKYYLEYLFGTNLTVIAFLLYTCNISNIKSADDRKFSGYFKALFLVLKTQKSIYLRIRNLYKIISILGNTLQPSLKTYNISALLEGDLFKIYKLLRQLESEITFQDEYCELLVNVMEYIIKMCPSGETALDKLKDEDFDIWKETCKKAIDIAEEISSEKVSSERQKFYCALQYFAMNENFLF